MVDRLTRRRLLRTGLATGATVAIAGCSGGGGDGGNASDGNASDGNASGGNASDGSGPTTTGGGATTAATTATPEETATATETATPTETRGDDQTVPRVSVTFDYRSDSGEVTITHTAGDVVQAESAGKPPECPERGLGVKIRPPNAPYRTSCWEAPISAGDTTTVSVSPGSTVRVIWVSPSGDRSAVLAEFEVPGGPETTTPSDSDAFVDGDLQFMLSPTAPQAQMRAQYAPIEERLREYVDSVEDVELQFARNYAATLTALEVGTADAAETGSFTAAVGLMDGVAEPILQRYGYGSWTYSSVILTREESEVTSLTDLEGEKIAFADALSASGSLYPLYMLERAGLSIPDEPGSPAGADFEPSWSAHATAFNALMQGEVAAAGVGQFIAVDPDTGEYKEGIAELAKESDIPRAPIVASTKLADEEVRTLKDAFLEADPSLYLGEDGQRDTDDDLWFTKVREADAATYQPVVEVAETLGYGREIFK